MDDLLAGHLSDLLDVNDRKDIRKYLYTNAAAKKRD
jgi:hypothetical protein